MAGNSAEMKVKATMDNSDLKKKSKESKDALKDFAKVGEDAVSSLGSAFGVNTGKIEQMMSAVRGLGENLSKSGNTGAAALGNLLKGVNGLTAGIAGIGIGAAVAGFKMLKDEAENFKQTVAGANIELATTAYIDTYKQVIHDFNRDLGQGFAETESKWKKFWGTAGATIKAYVTSGAIVAALNPQAQGFGADNLTQFRTVQQQAADAAAEAERLQEEILNLTDDLSKKSVEWQKTESRIAELKRKAYDTTVDTTERQKALAEVQRLITERCKEEYNIRNNIATKTHQLNELASSSKEDEHKENELKKQAYSVLVAMNDKMRELLEKQATLTRQANEEAQARMQAVDAYEKMALHKADTENFFANGPGMIKTPDKAVAMETPGIAVPVTPELDTDSVIDISNELQTVLTSSFDNIGTALGGLIGDLATGGDAWSNFSSTAISAFGDMAISVGKMAISTGTATLGIKAALESLNGYVAIAAGVALVALGTAVKTGLSNIASGNYSAAGAVASAGGYGGSSSFGSDYESREFTVKVTGTLRADGNQLLSVIENENNRKTKTT